MMKINLIIFLFAFCSCATVRKDRSSITTDQQRIDTSSQEHLYQKETTTEEKSTASVMTNADSVETSGTVSAEDTTTHQQTVETDDLSLITTVKPKVNKNGKVTGYDVNSKAVAKPKTIDVPVDRKTTTKETGSDKQQTGITDTKKETVTTSSKSAFRFNFAGVCAIVGIAALILLFIYFKYRK
jgi:hypothetical protein